MDGKEKWTTYKFTKSVYKTWLSTHIARIRFAVDDISLRLNSQEPRPSEESGLL
jgi:hypothetical protein